MRERLFTAGEPDSGAVHAIGNGEIMLYGVGPEWMQVLGAPYSSPTVFSLEARDGLRTSSFRTPASGSWRHAGDGVELTDCASRAQHCIARRWKGEARFFLDAKGFRLTDQKALFPGCAGAWLIQVSADTPYYNDYPLNRQQFFLICADGNCESKPGEQGVLLTLREEGTLYVTGAENLPGCVRGMQNARAAGFDVILAASMEEDTAFLTRCAENRGPMRTHEAAERAIEDTLLQIRAQQHVSGGVQAGYNYHLAYVRDQYGVFRGLLAMGAWDEARAILAFYRDVFEQSGKIANAQAMGIRDSFHVHEEDRSEITGYLLIQACDYLRVTGDREFFRSLRPMLDWALRAQLDCLHGDMMPFNGDETYVAGGILPRTVLNHGSFEATMLLLTGGRRYLDMCEMSESVKTVKERLDRVAEAFERNFRRGDRYATNSLLRLEGLVEPEFHHGVCNGCGSSFGWLRRRGEGFYCCPACNDQPIPEPCRREYMLTSTLLMAQFVDTAVISRDELRTQTEAFLREYRRSGKLPSRPDGDICCGYDPGLLLYAAARNGLAAEDLLDFTLELQDECGAWSEYYDGKKPRNTRCRPWESAINMTGILEYLRK